jgi:hypothetical protein
MKIVDFITYGAYGTLGVCETHRTSGAHGTLELISSNNHRK